MQAPGIILLLRACITELFCTYLFCWNLASSPLAQVFFISPHDPSGLHGQDVISEAIGGGGPFCMTGGLVSSMCAFSGTVVILLW